MSDSLKYCNSISTSASSHLFLQVNYSQPLVAVKFMNITANEDVNVECKINNIPIGSERDKFAGKVSFKLRINTNK